MPRFISWSMVARKFLSMAAKLNLDLEGLGSRLPINSGVRTMRALGAVTPCENFCSYVVG